MRLPDQSMGVNRTMSEAPQLAIALEPSGAGTAGGAIWCTDDSCDSLKTACKNGQGNFDCGSTGGTFCLCTVGDVGHPVRQLAILDTTRCLDAGRRLSTLPNVGCTARI